MTKNRSCGFVIVALTCTGWSAAQTTIVFDRGLDGETDFSVAGSNWTGGQVQTQGFLPLYASGRFSYHVLGDGAMVTLDEPVDSVSFFYVHGFGFGQGTAAAWDANNNMVGVQVVSNEATSFNDPANFMLIERGDKENQISAVTFSDGVIDDFSFPARTDDMGNPIGSPGCASLPGGNESGAGGDAALMLLLAGLLAARPLLTREPAIALNVDALRKNA